MTHLGPYELDKVHLGDCIELMKALPDKSVVTITDPVWPNATPELIGSDDPYGLFARAAQEIERVSIRIAVQLGCNSDPRFLSPLQMPFFRTCWLRYALPHPAGRLLVSGDVAFLFGVAPASREGFRIVPGETTEPSGLSVRERNEHPCPRRIGHVKWLIDKWCEEEETVFDPFIGSGTTGVAALKTGRRFLGFEIDPRWCDLANKRIEAAKAQTTLFL